MSKPRGPFDEAVEELKEYLDDRRHVSPGDCPICESCRKAIAVLEAAGKVHPWEDMDGTCDMSESDIRLISRAIYEAYPGR